MPTLRELQAAFRGALLDGRDGDPAGAIGAEILADGLSPESRLAVYRHHVLATLTSVLRETYPVVTRLVGEGFFAYAADAFVRQHPPQAPCLFEYGAGFAGFLAAFPPCRELVYLPDVARLEWAMQAALHAEETRPADLERLREIPPHSLGRVMLRLDPSLTLLSSPWPVDRIWRANQPGAEAEAALDLGAGGACVEVRRLGDDVVWRTLSPAELAFRAALAAASTLEGAAESVLAIDAEFDLTRALATLFAEGLVVGFETAP
jgi:hypothetical protein